jgi:hypothetical protein
MVNINKKTTIATSFQVVQKEDKELTIQEFFNKYHQDKNIFNIDKKINDTLKTVNLKAPLDKKINSFS